MARKVVLLLVLALLAAVPSAAPATAGPNDPTIVFGAFPAPRSGQTKQQAVTALEAQIGRKLNVVRVYDLWDTPLPDSHTSWLRSTGHTLFLSVKAKRTNGTLVSWRQLADARPGSGLYNEIVGWATKLKNFGAPLYFTFHHEPEAATNLNNGTATDFIDAWRNIISVLRLQGVTNAQYVWTMTDYSFVVPSTDRRAAFKWFPGDAYVDHLGSDPYNWYNCREGINNSWKSLAQIIEPFRQFGAAHPTKGLMLPEWASYEDPATPGRKAQWIADARALFKSPGYEQFKLVLYFNWFDQKYTNCRWWVDTSQSSLTNFAAMANDPFYTRLP